MRAATQLTSTDDVLELMDASVPAAAVCSALRLGLFWRLDSRPLDTEEIGRALAIPAGRSRQWLELLCGIGLLDRRQDLWSTSGLARALIVDVYSESTWAMLGQEALERLASVHDLPAVLRQGLDPAQNSSYVDRMAADPDRARRFCRMLYELHQALAERVAAALDLKGVGRLLDLGGGSGVIAIALARRHPGLRITVLDIASVCDAGREIVEEHRLADRIEFHPADFVAEALPSGFDLVLECDVGVYDEALFARIRKVVGPDGRFVIVDDFAGDHGIDDLAQLAWAFEHALRDPDVAPPTAAATRAMLDAAGFELLMEAPLPALPNVGGRVTDGLVLLEARPR